MSELQGKALYNLLKFNCMDNPSMKVEPWQVEDLTKLSTPTLFERLKALQIHLDEESYILYSEKCDTPEDLTEVLVSEDQEELHDKIYLLIFELWRRLLPEKPSLSLFCDTLDHLIEAHDREILEDEEALPQALTILEDVLDDTTDREKKATEEVFTELSTYCAHDLECFLFDHIEEQIAAENTTYASELLDAFYPYVTDKRRFDFLRAHLFALINIEGGNLLLERLLEDLTENPDKDLLLRMAESLVNRGDVRLFMAAVRQALPLLREEGEFQDLLVVIANYYRCLDRESEQQLVEKLIHERKERSLETPLNLSDETLKKIGKLISEA